MADTMTSQNIDLSSWDTLYSAERLEWLSEQLESMRKETACALRKTPSQYSQYPDRNLKPGLPDYKAGVPTTRPRSKQM
jgi:hypothetical protein